MRTIEELEHSLHAGDTAGPALGAPDLELIRRLGRRRRRGRRLVAAAGGVLAAAIVAAMVPTVTGPGDPGGEGAPAATQVGEHAAPQTMHPLAARALREVPGAVRVSPTQVVIPGPDVPEEPGIAVDDRIVGTPVALPAHVYSGVTMFPRSAFPAWLHDGVADYEETELAGPDGSHPVGSTDIGILVDKGVAGLGCTAWHESEPHDNANCAPTVMTRVAGQRYLEWSMGTEDFLTPGARMEVFLADDFSTGRPSTLAIAGIDGTRAARVEFVTTTGEVVEGTVESGTITEGDSLFHANVPGELATVIAYDTAGEVLEDHEILPCSNPEDCEVR